MKQRFFFILFLYSLFDTNAQNANIGGVINSYAAGVHQISSTQLNINQIALFNIHDTILVYQAQGALAFTANNSTFGDVSNFGNAGNYDFSIIQSIDIPNNTITLACPLLNTYDDNSFQIIKVKTYTNATVTSTLTCYPWDGEKGGVLVLIVNGNLSLGANIDVTGKGFRGADSPHINNLNKCSNEATGGLYSYYYTINGYDSAGLKGEGISKLPLMMARGRGRWSNGGGGGNGINSGGGGGSHAGQGGNGGRESDACFLVTQNYGGIGGTNLFSSIISNAQKIFLGGGGGTGTYEQYPSDVSKGGNGGGIVIVLAAKIITNNYQIIANGESVNYTTTYESAGGGGGGGSIVVMAPFLAGNLALNSMGGNGGSSNISSCRGSGGGGSGGIVYYSTPTGTSANVNKGTAGSACTGYKGTDGSNGIVTQNFQFRLNCLTDNNVIQANQTICPGITPALLTGEISPFFVSYLWQYSYDNINWQNCSGTNNQANYQSNPLSQITYFRRIVVTSNGSVTEIDTSNVVTIQIVPLHTNSSSIDVLCNGQNTGSATVNPTGGSGGYTFIWSNGNTTNSINNVSAGVYLVTTTDNTGCSKIDTLSIYQPPALTAFTTQTNVTCNGLHNGTATVNASGGTPPYNYSWSNGSYTQTTSGLSATTYTVTTYDNHGCTILNSVSISQPLPITINTTVTNASCSYSCNGSILVNASGGTPPYSVTPNNLTNLCPGNYNITVTDANGCSSTTTKNISITTNLQNNVISSNANQLCSGDIQTITGSLPSGAGTISYQWKRSFDNVTWYSAPNINYNQNYTWIADQNSYFKRIIIGNGCFDTSNVVGLNVTPISNQIFTSDTIYCNYETPFIINGTDSSGYTYQWQINTGTGWTNTGISTIDFVPPSFSNTLSVRRVVSFNNCTDTSNVINLYSFNALTSNSILIDNSDTTKQYCGFAQGVIDGAITGAVGSVTISWLLSYDLTNWNLLPDTTTFLPFTLNDFSNHRFYYYKRIIEQSGCYDTSNIVTIDIIPPIVGNLIQSTLGLGSLAHVCIGTTLWLGSINVNPAGGTGTYNYHWLQSSDSLTWQNALGPNSYQAYSTPAIYDTVYYSRVVSSSVCVDTSNVFSIYPILLPNNLIVTNQATYCQGTAPDTITEAINTQGMGLSYQWQWLNNGNWENIPGANYPNFTPPFVLGERMYRRVIQLNNCSSNSNEISIFGYNQPSMTFFLEENDSLCLTPNLFVHIHVHLEGTSPWNIEFNVNGNHVVSNQFNADSVYSISINQVNYKIFVSQLSDAGTCSGTIPPDTIFIYVFNPISANSSSMELCGNIATLQASSPSPGIGTWILPPNISVNDIHNPNAQAFTSAYGTYTALWKVENGPCVDTNHVSLTFFEPPQAPNAGHDLTLSENQPIIMQATAPTAGIGTWVIEQGAASISDIHNPQTTVSNFTQGITILRWEISNGVCPIVFDKVTIELNKLFVPEGFSPNGDGVNDYFVIEGIELGDTYSLQIFDRWGNIVFENEAYQNNWNGKNMNEKQLPDDTYFYLLKKQDKVKRSGYVILKR
ncbi:MAG: hypothetical protein Fur0028_00260 [Bacteroidales bacterium]